MKVRSSVKKMCKGCKVTKYNQKVYIRCKENPRHKQRQLFSTMREGVGTFTLGDQMQAPLQQSWYAKMESHYLSYDRIKEMLL